MNPADQGRRSAPQGAASGREREAATIPEARCSRVVIETVMPEIDGGRFAVKRVVGERVDVEADVFADGHDCIVCVVQFRHTSDSGWRETRMEPLGNDRWRGSFLVEREGVYEYAVAGWVDGFLTWRQQLGLREDAVDIGVALQDGAELLHAANERAKVAQGGAGREVGSSPPPTRNGGRAPGGIRSVGAGGPGPEKKSDTETLRWFAATLASDSPWRARRDLALSPELQRLMAAYPDRRCQTLREPALRLVAERAKARFSAWYELFPRSTTVADDIAHGTLRSTIARLPYVAEMGFDVLYLPPIHPIGLAHRKGRNNALQGGEGDPGSPWAIGSRAGGHKAVHPDLGTLDDFRMLVREAAALGIEVALDIALQCSPDHPYVREHPEWFRHRPDGTIQYAENPPKKYEDIYPLDFGCEGWRALWAELKSIFMFWAAQGVRIFRVDNPHTKPFAFWEWLIREVRNKYPDALFLAEAFSRPRIMHRLAKLGFTQSYTYFTWRNTRHELTEYLTQLNSSPTREYYRPNFWPNTPDILHEYLQVGGRPAFMCRVVLAATLSANYGIYGPAFELLEATPREHGSEEYLDSEKYQIRTWDLDTPASLASFIGQLNRIRRENVALQSDRTLRFHDVGNDHLLAYSKRSADGTNIMLTVVNLDPHHVQAGEVELPLPDWGIADDKPYQVHDLLSGARYLWQGRRNYVELDPGRSPAHVFRLRRYMRTERDFDYYL